jgi:hypothetical protein
MKKNRHAELLERFTAPMPSVRERMAANKAASGWHTNLLRIGDLGSIQLPRFETQM